ncbi:hypothetical protein C8Q76DRAFT_624382, partial [Earliella scabrosa]
RLTNAHTAEYITEKLLKCLQEYGIAKKVIAVTCNNTSTNGTIMRKLATLVPGSLGSETCVRCFGHVLNLVVKVVYLLPAPSSHVSTDIRFLQAIMSQFVRRHGCGVDPAVEVLGDPMKTPRPLTRLNLNAWRRSTWSSLSLTRRSGSAKWSSRRFIDPTADIPFTP